MFLYSQEVPPRGTSNEYPHVFMEKLVKFIQNYHQILLLNKSKAYASDTEKK